MNGEQRTFVELVEMVHRGVRAEVFTVDAHRNVRIKPLRAPRLVKRNDPVVKVTLVSGAEIVCTPDHRFMLRDGTYREAGKLKAKDQLMPFARTAIPERLHRTGAFPIPASLSQTVTSVAPAGRADVYDLTVDVTANFALAAGVFVHNSIDDDPPAHMRYCAAGDTLVRTVDGTKRIDSFAPNAGPLSDTDVEATVLDRRGSPVRASKFFHSGTHPTLRLRTREGYELTGTQNHPVLTLQSVLGVPMLIWTLLEEINPGDRVAVVRGGATSNPTNEVNEREHALATLAGGMVSEGWAARDEAGFDNLDEAYFGAVRDAYAEVVGAPPETRVETLKSTNRLSRLHTQSVAGMAAFRASPLLPMIGVHAADKVIPDYVWHGSLAFKATFLRALFEGDGSSSILRVRGGNAIQISYSSQSQALVSGVQQLLLEFGVVSKQCHYDNGEIKLVITNRRDARLFASKIGFHVIKQRKLERELAEIPLTSTAMSHDLVPFVAE
ncbi:MAG TPA: LAGLIDADG family homing endonuclease, partial [Candidatus Limnocylindria bacterium]